MSKLGRLWDWLLPGLISLSQMGALAYYIADCEEEEMRKEPMKARLRVVVAA
jgi:hypothetical protein